MSKTARDEGSSANNKGDEATNRSSKRARSSPPTNTATESNNGISSAAELAAANVNRQTLAGRRGDIRMHKAVAARMADPCLSPFEALKLGGFDYPSDEEPTSVDSEKVTLSQRKNQLSRRVRLAKKQIMEGGNTGDVFSGVGSSSPVISSKKRSSNHRKQSPEPPLLSEEPSCRAHDHHHSKSHRKTRRKASSSSSSHNHNHNNNTATRTITDASAIASLMASAQAMGLSLNQLADTVAANRTYLAHDCMANTSSEQIPKQEKVALRLHAIESKSLYDKSLVLAGADVDKEYVPNSHAHLSYCYHAWQAEGKRLRGVMEEHQYPILDIISQKNKAGHVHEPKDNHDSHGHSHSHDHHDDDDDLDLHKPGAFAKHLHRLDGQCGHKAVIHRPKDGVPHIDFIVGDVVECYHGVDPIKRPKRNEPIMKWQSKYTCDQVNCEADCSADQHHEVLLQQQQQQSSPAITNHEVTTTAEANHHQEDTTITGTSLTDTPTVPPSHNTNIAAAPTIAEEAPQASSSGHIHYHHLTQLACPQAMEPITIPINTIQSDDPQWNFDPEESMDDLLSGLLMANQHHEL